MSTKTSKFTEIFIAEPLDQRKLKKRAEPAETLPSFSLKDDPSQCIQIGSLLPEKEKNRQQDFLHRNADIFAWPTSDMP